MVLFFTSPAMNLKPSAAFFKRSLFLVLAILLLAGCVSTPEGRKFDPIQGAKRMDECLDMSIDRLQSRTHEDKF